MRLISTYDEVPDLTGWLAPKKRGDSILIWVVDSGFGRGFVTRLVAVVSTLLFGLCLLGLDGEGVTASGGPQMRV